MCVQYVGRDGQMRRWLFPSFLSNGSGWIIKVMDVWIIHTYLLTQTRIPCTTCVQLCIVLVLVLTAYYLRISVFHDFRRPLGILKECMMENELSQPLVMRKGPSLLQTIELVSLPPQMATFLNIVHSY